MIGALLSTLGPVLFGGGAVALSVFDTGYFYKASLSLVLYFLALAPSSSKTSVEAPRRLILMFILALGYLIPASVVAYYELAVQWAGVLYGLVEGVHAAQLIHLGSEYLYAKSMEPVSGEDPVIQRLILGISAAFAALSGFFLMDCHSDIEKWTLDGELGVGLVLFWVTVAACVASVVFSLYETNGLLTDGTGIAAVFSFCLWHAIKLDVDPAPSLMFELMTWALPFVVLLSMALYVWEDRSVDDEADGKLVWDAYSLFSALLVLLVTYAVARASEANLSRTASLTVYSRALEVLAAGYWIFRQVRSRDPWANCR